MKKDTFENYLIDRHAAQYQGLDDEMPEDFDEWLEDTDPEELIRYAEEWNKLEQIETKDTITIPLKEYEQLRSTTDITATAIMAKQKGITMGLLRKVRKE